MPIGFEFFSIGFELDFEFFPIGFELGFEFLPIGFELGFELVFKRCVGAVDGAVVRFYYELDVLVI